MALIPLTIMRSPIVSVKLWVEDTDSKQVRQPDNSFEEVLNVRKIEAVSLDHDWEVSYKVNGVEKASFDIGATRPKRAEEKDLSISERFYLDTTEQLEFFVRRTHGIDLRPGSVSTGALIAAGTDTNSTATCITASLSPSANIIMAIIAGLDDVAGDFVYQSGPTESFSDNPTWASNILSPNRAHGSLYWGVGFGGSPGSSTVSLPISGTNTKKSWVAGEFTGHDVSTPASEVTASANGVSTSLTVSMTDLAAGARFCSGICDIGNGNVTSGQTEIGEATTGGGTGTVTNLQEGISLSQTWTELDGRANVGLAIEILQAAAGGLSIPVAAYHYNNQGIS